MAVGEGSWAQRSVAAVLLVLLSPVLLVVAYLVRRDLGAPVLFQQVRPGHKGQLFTLVKFRSMREVAETGATASDGARLTRLGIQLRQTSLDELPSLWNIMRGDMNFVGPRPLLPEYLDRYSAEQSRRHDVKPGLTGLAQVSGRNALDWEKRLALDVQYVDQRSFALDMRILLRTVSRVVRSEGVTAPGHATVSEFLGGKPGRS